MRYHRYHNRLFSLKRNNKRQVHVVSLGYWRNSNVVILSLCHVKKIGECLLIACFIIYLCCTVHFTDIICSFTLLCPKQVWNWRFTALYALKHAKLNYQSIRRSTLLGNWIDYWCECTSYIKLLRIICVCRSDKNGWTMHD